MTDSNHNEPPKKDEESSAADDWANALDEQHATEQADSHAAADDGGSAEDLWGDAMAEQGAAEAQPEPEPQQPAAAASKAESSDIFKPLEDGAAAAGSRELDMIMEIPVTLSVELGQTRLTIRELLDLAQGSVIELDGLAGEPMDIQINGYLIAQGEVVVVDDNYGIRISEIITPSERIHKLKR